MKLSTFIQVAVLLALIGFAAIGCASSRQYPDSRRYPNPDSRRYPYPDSRRYPGDDRTVIIVPNRLPPGQAKKIYGERSARRYAPGHNRRYDNRRYDRERYYDKDYNKYDREKGNGKKKKNWK